MKTLNKETGKRIKTLRKQQGLTQEKLGELVGSNQEHISKLEKGVLNPSVDYLQKIATALKVELKIILQ